MRVSFIQNWAAGLVSSFLTLKFSFQYLFQSVDMLFERFLAGDCSEESSIGFFTYKLFLNPYKFQLFKG